MKNVGGKDENDHWCNAGFSLMEAKQRKIVQQSGKMKPDSELAEKPIRSRFAAGYKLRGLCLAELKAKIQLVMDKDTDIEHEPVDEIPPGPSGKYLYTISKVGHEQN